MAASLYTVLEADYLDQQAGLKIGATVEAVPAENPSHLLVTQVVGATFPLDEPIAVDKSQLKAA